MARGGEVGEGLGDVLRRLLGCVVGKVGGGGKLLLLPEVSPGRAR